VEEGFQFVAAGRADGELIVDVFEFRGGLRRGGDERGKPGGFEEAGDSVGAVSAFLAAQASRCAASRAGPAACRACRRLVGADHLVEIFGLAAMDAQHLKGSAITGRGGDHAAIANASQIFRGEKTEQP